MVDYLSILLLDILKTNGNSKFLFCRIMKVFWKLMSWVTGAQDRAATRGSITLTLVLHHLSSFIFEDNANDKLPMRNKLAKSLLRDYSRKQRHEVCKFFGNY